MPSVRPPSGHQPLADTRADKRSREAAVKAAERVGQKPAENSTQNATAKPAERAAHGQPAPVKTARKVPDTHVPKALSSTTSAEEKARRKARVINTMTQRAAGMERGVVRRNWDDPNIPSTQAQMARLPPPQATVLANSGPPAGSSNGADGFNNNMQEKITQASIANSGSAQIGLAQHQERSARGTETRNQASRGSQPIRGQARGTLAQRAAERLQRPLSGPGRGLAPADTEMIKEELTMFISAYMDVMMPGVDQSSLSEAEKRQVISDMERVMNDGPSPPVDERHLDTTLSRGQNDRAHDAEPEEHLPPPAWNMSKERYQYIVAFMKRYRPLDRPESIGEEERESILKLVDDGMFRGRLALDIPVAKPVKQSVTGAPDTGHHSSPPMITLRLDSQGLPAYTKEQLAVLTRYASVYRAKMTSSASGGNGRDPSGGNLPKGSQGHSVAISQQEPFVGQRMPREDQTRLNPYIRTELEKADVMKNKNIPPHPAGPPANSSSTSYKPVTRPRDGRDGGRVTGSRRDNDAQVRLQRPDNTIKMAPDAATQTEEKIPSMKTYIERYQFLKSKQELDEGKKGEPLQPQGEIISVVDELPPLSQCTNPLCECNQQYLDEASNSQLDEGSKSIHYETPPSSNGAEYGSESEASRREPLKTTFEEVLLSTAAFSKRTKLPTHIDEHPCNVTNACMDDIVSKALAKFELRATQVVTEVEREEACDILEHYRQSTIASSLKERERLIHAMRELNDTQKPCCNHTHTARPKREKVSPCGATNSEIFSGFRAVVAEQLRAPPRTPGNEGPAVTVPSFLAPALYSYMLKHESDAPPKRRRRRRNRGRRADDVEPLPADLKKEIDHWETQFKELDIPEEEYMQWMTARYNSFCKGLEKLQRLVTDMKEGPPSPQIDHILKAAQGATGIPADKYVLKPKGDAPK